MASRRKKEREVPASSSGSEGEEEEEEETGSKAKLQIPVARVRKLIKSDPDVKKISNDATLLIAHSTEMFVDFLVREAYRITKDDTRKTLQYKDLATSVQENDILDFLLVRPFIVLPSFCVVDRLKGQELRDVAPQRQTKYEIEKRMQSKQEKGDKQPSPSASSRSASPPASASSSSSNGKTKKPANDDDAGEDEAADGEQQKTATERKEGEEEEEKKENGKGEEEDKTAEEKGNDKMEE